MTSTPTCLDRLAADNGGTVTYVQPGEDLEAVLTGFYAQIAHPVLTDLQIELKGLEALDLHPRPCPTCFRLQPATDRPLPATSRSSRSQSGQASGQAREYSTPLTCPRPEATILLPRLWPPPSGLHARPGARRG